MAKYVDAFVLPVPKKNLKSYIKMANFMAKLCQKYGALDYIECQADDVQKGKVTSFPQSVKLKAGETVIFSCISYKSRAHRDSVNKKVMNDPKMLKMMDSEEMPFDGMRMFWGGFKTIVSI